MLILVETVDHCSLNSLMIKCWLQVQTMLKKRTKSSLKVHSRWKAYNTATFVFICLLYTPNEIANSLICIMNANSYVTLGAFIVQSSALTALTSTSLSASIVSSLKHVLFLYYSFSKSTSKLIPKTLLSFHYSSWLNTIMKTDRCNKTMRHNYWVKTDSIEGGVGCRDSWA